MKRKSFAFKALVILLYLICQNTNSQTTINMQKEGGVFTVPCYVNGLKLSFIFDTGASDVSISLTEALFMLKNGYLKHEDIIGKQNYIDATGKISVGTIINIKKIDFSGLTLYNIKASIVDELSAPLLLGQSAMTKLGRFIFDPINGKLTILNDNEYNNEIKKPISNLEKPKPTDTSNAEARTKQAQQEEEAKKIYDEEYASVKSEMVKYFAAARATATKSETGLESKITQTGSGKKPVEGSNIYIHYAGYLEDGSLFDSSMEEVAKAYGKFDQGRADQNGYQPFPFPYGKKDGLIPGFLEGISNLSFGDKAILFIPSKLGYGERGAGNVIPGNANIIFEVELFESLPEKK